MTLQRLLVLTLFALAVSACDGSDADFDGDGYADRVDCEPENPDVHPNATEVCDDGIDQDCDDSDNGPNPDCDGDGYGT